MTNLSPDNRLTIAKDLVAALEKNDQARADQLCDDLAGIRESSLYQEIGYLTRQLHDTMNSFSADSSLNEIAENDIPDAKERLQYVITMTEQAANQTLTVVEDLMPVSQELHQQSNSLAENWQRFLVKKMPFDEFKDMSQELTEHFKYSVGAVEQIQNGLNEVLMAQGFQDITGQIIRKVINLVQNLEENMVELIKVSGNKHYLEKNSKQQDLPGPVVPKVDDRNNDVATSQDDVDDLLSSLGF